MSGFFDKIKDAFGSTKKPPKFKIYEPAEIKMMALRTRVILTQSMDQLLKHISADDQKFRFVGTNPSETYTLLQSIGEKVIEAESIKIFIEMMRKVENNSTNIAKTNGDISLLKTELQWFQCVLWYRKAKEATKLDDLYAFCMDFFKGVDITKEMDVNCEVFKLYPILKYLKKNDVLPLAEVLFYLQPYVSCNISKPMLDAIFEVNKQEIVRKSIDRASLNDPRSKIGPSKVYPNSAIFTVQQSPPKRSSNPYEIKEASNSQTNQGNNSFVRNPTGNMSNIQSTTNFINPNGNNYPQNQSIYGGNTLNLPYNSPNYSQFPPQQQPNSNQFVINDSNGFAPQNTNYSPYNIPGPQADHNPFANNSKFNNSTLNQHQNISNFNPHNNPIPEKKQPMPLPPEPKKSFFNSLMRANSQQQRMNNDRQREQGDFIYNQANQSFIPLSRDTYDQFNNTNNYAKEFQIEQQRKREAEQLARAEEIRKAEQNRKAQELRAQQIRAQQRRQAEEAAIRLQLQRQIRQDQERRKQEILQKERERAEQLDRMKRRQEQQARAKAEQEERKAREQREEQQRRDREEEQRERERQQRMREREREEQRQLNVFVDNERETFDRGFSGRFSSNMGFKYDFDEYQAEELASDSHNMNSSLLRFKKDESPLPPEIPLVSLGEQDQTESLQLIESGYDNTSAPPFKLFYYKKEGK